MGKSARPTLSAGARLNFSQRFEEIRTGFERPFWVANISEIFERLSYYAVFAVLARYLHEALQFPSEQASSLSGFFGAGVWVWRFFGARVAVRSGFRAEPPTPSLIL